MKTLTAFTSLTIASLSALPILACGGDDANEENLCVFERNEDGTSQHRCEDGTILSYGENEQGAAGASGGDDQFCTVEDAKDGSTTITCPDGSSTVIEGNSHKTDPASCSVEETSNGTNTISCPDGTTAVISQGADGADGSNGEDGADGSNGEDGADGSNGEDGADGSNGEDGADGTLCTVTQNSNETSTVDCSDGTSAIISNGSSGLNSLMNVTPSTTECLAGGLIVESGVDDDGNGILESSEVDNTNILCAPATPCTPLPASGTLTISGTHSPEDPTWNLPLSADTCPANLRGGVASYDTLVFCNNTTSGEFDIEMVRDLSGFPHGDPYVVIYAGWQIAPNDLECIEADDDSGTDANAIVVDLPVAYGEYITVVPSGFAEEDMHDYQIVITRK